MEATWGRVALALVLVAVGGVLLSLALSSHGPSVSKLAPPTLRSAFGTPTELMGGCAERRLDRGHDTDPPGLNDQENDECIPAQHERRSPDGQPITSTP